MKLFLFYLFLFYFYTRIIGRIATETEPSHKEGREMIVLSCDAITHHCRHTVQHEFIIESVNWINADNEVGFYKLFILWGGTTKYLHL